MDPEMLKFMTDPEARKDPAKLRAMTAGILRNARTTAIDSARTNSVVMGTFGWIMIAAGVAVAALLGLGTIPTEVLFAGPLLVLMGGTFVFFARWTAMPSKRLLRTGSTARATVREVKALGRTIGIRKPGLDVTLSRVTVVLEVAPDAGTPFETLHSEFIVSGDLKHLQVGASVPVRFAPGKPTRLAIDWDAI